MLWGTVGWALEAFVALDEGDFGGRCVGLGLGGGAAVGDVEDAGGCGFADFLGLGVPEEGYEGVQGGLGVEAGLGCELVGLSSGL